MADQTCSWCGTRMRGQRQCPRGPGCAQEQANHEHMMAVIRAEDKEKKHG